MVGAPDAEDEVYQLSCFPVCLLLGEDFTFLESAKLLLFHFTCFSVSRIGLLLSSRCIPILVGVFNWEFFVGEEVSFKFTERRQNSVHLFNLLL